MAIMTGCCGYPVKKERYYENFKVVELRWIFYKIYMFKDALHFKIIPLK